jgi:hypothetical protein
MRRWSLLLAALALPALFSAGERAQSRAVTAPKAELGFDIGDDYHLANSTS